MKLRKGVKEDKPTNVFKREEYEILALKNPRQITFAELLKTNILSVNEK